jgi:hypothetical protein
MQKIARGFFRPVLRTQNGHNGIRQVGSPRESFIRQPVPSSACEPLLLSPTTHGDAAVNYRDDLLRHLFKQTRHMLKNPDQNVRVSYKFFNSVCYRIIATASGAVGVLDKRQQMAMVDHAMEQDGSDA